MVNSGLSQHSYGLKMMEINRGTSDILSGISHVFQDLPDVFYFTSSVRKSKSFTTDFDFNRIFLYFAFRKI